MKILIILILTSFLFCSLSVSAQDKAEKKIPPEIQELIDSIKQLSEDDAFEDMDRSIKMGNKNRLKVTLYVYPDLLNKQDEFGRTPLYNAVFAGKLELVKYLLSKRAKVTIPDVNGDTPLHRAAAEGPKEIVENLLKWKALYYTKNKKGRTPLFNAALQGETATAEVLLEAGDKINRVDKYGDTPLHLASLKGKGEMVTFLLEKGADYTIKNKKGKTPEDVAKNDKVKRVFSN
jgi:ankyrin repeat protein